MSNIYDNLLILVHFIYKDLNREGQCRSKMDTAYVKKMQKNHDKKGIRKQFKRYHPMYVLVFFYQLINSLFKAEDVNIILEYIFGNKCGYPFY